MNECLYTNSPEILTMILQKLTGSIFICDFLMQGFLGLGDGSFFQSICHHFLSRSYQKHKSSVNKIIFGSPLIKCRYVALKSNYSCIDKIHTCVCISFFPTTFLTQHSTAEITACICQNMQHHDFITIKPTAAQQTEQQNNSWDSIPTQ